MRPQLQQQMNPGMQQQIGQGIQQQQQMRLQQAARLRNGLPAALRGMRPGLPGKMANGMPRLPRAAGLPQGVSAGQIRQKSAFKPSPGGGNRPVQVRTVFVPPPMNMEGSSVTSTPNGQPRQNGGPPKMINSFPLNMNGNQQQPGITITPLSKQSKT